MSLPTHLLDQFRYNPLSNSSPSPHASPGKRARNSEPRAGGGGAAKRPANGQGSSGPATGRSPSAFQPSGSAGNQILLSDDEDDFQPTASAGRGPAAASRGGGKPKAAAAALCKIDELVKSLSRLSGYSNQIVDVHKFAARQAKTKALDNLCNMSNKNLKTHIAKQPLYVHQSEAIDGVFEGNNVIVATGTASGKSKCYLVPCMEVLASKSEVDKDSRCMFLFPLKALAQDQLRATTRLLEELKMKRVQVAATDATVI